MTSPALARLGPRGRWPFDADTWRLWEHSLQTLPGAGPVTLPGRSAATALAEFVAAAREDARTSTAPDPHVAALLAHGVALEDLLSFHAVNAVDTDGDAVSPDAAAEHLLLNYLVGMARDYPDLPVREAIGWALVSASFFMLRVWHDAGLLRGGWRFVAAGLGRDEARAALKSSAGVDETGLATLARLRGERLPV